MNGGTHALRRRKLLLALTSVFLTLVALELAIRVFDAARGRSWNARTSWYWMFERDPYLGYRGRAHIEIDFGPDGVYRHNGDGFRDQRELQDIARMSERRLVICVGESSTYGSGAPDAKDTYPARLEAHLRRLSGDDRWVVYNAGMPAYSSYEVTRLLQLRLLKYRPEGVVMMDLRNDVEFSARILDDTTGYDNLPLRSAPMQKTLFNELAMRSSLVGLVASRFANAQSETVRDSQRRLSAAITPRGRAFYVDNLSLAALLCDRAGSRLMLVDQPIYDETQPPPRRAATAELRRTMAETCARLHVPLLSADRPLHASGFQSPGEVHLGPTGYDRLAGILAPQVLETLGPVGGR
jgi:hypothetical protein